MNATNQTPSENPLFYFLTEESTPEYVCESLEALLYGFVYYAAESGMSSSELLKHYDTGRALINLFQADLFHQLENKQLHA